MAFIEKLREAQRAASAPPRDTWERALRRAMEGVQAMSTAALLDLVGARATTGNARRLAAVMRDLKFIPIKTRRLMPGGYRDTVTRGWTRPVRPLLTHEKVERSKDRLASSPEVRNKEQFDV
jgi:hypothetical protein